MNSIEKGGPREAKRVADRLLVWGFAVGVVLAVLQAGALPFLGVFSSLSEVQEQAKMRASSARCFNRSTASSSSAKV